MLPSSSPTLKAGFQQLVVLHHTARPGLGAFHDRIEALTRHDLLLDLFEDTHGDAEEDLAASLRGLQSFKKWWVFTSQNLGGLKIDVGLS